VIRICVAAPQDYVNTDSTHSDRALCVAYAERNKKYGILVLSSLLFTLNMNVFVSYLGGIRCPFSCGCSAGQREYRFDMHIHISIELVAKRSP